MTRLNKIAVTLIVLSWFSIAICLIKCFTITDESWYYDWPGFKQQFKYAFSERPDYPLIATSALTAGILFPLGVLFIPIVKIITFIPLVIIAYTLLNNNPTFHSIAEKLINWGEWEPKENQTVSRDTK